MARSIVLICPGKVVSGGPEALHQLGRALLDLGLDAAMCYFPFGDPLAPPAAYARYDVPVRRFDAIGAAEVILPEARTGFARLFAPERTRIWWLSVTHYQGAGTAGDRHLPLDDLRSLRHLSQSAYATDFLARNGIAAQPLGDYLNHAHMAAPPGGPRRRQVAYNPKKGAQAARAIAARLPDTAFAPVEGMSPAQVTRLLRESMAYIDFGPHPGKDRLPREAAMAGACVLTGRQGAAGYAADIPIPEDYRIDDSAQDFIARAADAVRDILDNFQTRQRDFDGYREIIAGERATFYAQVRRAFQLTPAPMAAGLTPSPPARGHRHPHSG